jgi:hypothetical protein
MKMSNRPDPHQIWRVKDDANIIFTLSNMMAKNKEIGIENYKELTKEKRALIQDIGSASYEATPLPIEFLRPIVQFPSSGLAPDYFSMGIFFFCSERLREALAQPPDVIDYAPIEFRCTGAKAIAQNYQRMRILAVQPGMDLQRSRYDTFDWGDFETGEGDVRIHWIDKLVLQEGFQPKTEIFSLAEKTLCLLAQDPLAGRVLRANCTGLEFQHLDTPDFTSGRTITVRTKWGTRQRA